MDKIKKFIADKDTLTLWMNNLLVLYAFLLPISQSIKAKVFIAILILFILRGDIKKYVKEALSNKVIVAFVYFFLIYLFSLFWSENIKEGLIWIKSIKYGLYLIVFYSFIDGRYIKKVLTAFIMGMLLSEFISYGMILGILPWELSIGRFHFYAAPSSIDPSPFLNHIHYGVALSFVVILLAQQIYLSKKSIFIKMLMSIFVFTASANIFVTGGRTGYVTFVLLLSTLAIFYLRKWAIVAFLFIGLVLGTAYNQSPVVKLKVEQTLTSVEKLLNNKPNFNTSIGIRAGMYYYGWQAVKNDLILGVGTGDSMSEIYKQSPENWAGRAQPHEHNQFLSTFVKLGLVGLLVFLNIFYQIFKYKQEDKELRFIMIFSTLTVAFGILTTQFNMRFFMPLWVVMLTITLISKERRTIVQTIDDKKVLIQIAIACFLFGIYNLYSKSS